MICICLYLTVVRQALLQNQTPEIQAKLLAMQKRMVQQKSVELKSLVQTAAAAPIVSHHETVKVVDAPAKQRPQLSQEQKEEHAR